METGDLVVAPALHPLLTYCPWLPRLLEGPAYSLWAGSETVVKVNHPLPQLLANSAF